MKTSAIGFSGCRKDVQRRGGWTVDATAALVVILCLGLLARRAERRPAVETHPVGLAPPSPPGADRLELEHFVRFQCEPCERFAAIKAAYERGAIDEAHALYLLERE